VIIQDNVGPPQPRCIPGRRLKAGRRKKKYRKKEVKEEEKINEVRKKERKFFRFQRSKKNLSGKGSFPKLFFQSFSISL